MFKLSKDRLMRYRPLSSKLYSKNRDHFIRGLESGGLAVFNSNDIYPISADSTLPFAQHRDIFYLSGIDQEESILLLFPDAPKPEHRERYCSLRKRRREDCHLGRAKSNPRTSYCFIRDSNCPLAR